MKNVFKTAVNAVVMNDHYRLEGKREITKFLKQPFKSALRFHNVYLTQVDLHSENKG